jgi:hypothetical protein
MDKQKEFILNYIEGVLEDNDEVLLDFYEAFVNKDIKLDMQIAISEKLEEFTINEIARESIRFFDVKLALEDFDEVENNG